MTNTTSDTNPLDPPDTIDQIRSIPLTYVKSCWWHRWGAWVDVKEGIITIDDRKVGRYVYQERRCSRCNLVELNKIQT